MMSWNTKCSICHEVFLFFPIVSNWGSKQIHLIDLTLTFKCFAVCAFMSKVRCRLTSVLHMMLDAT